MKLQQQMNLAALATLVFVNTHAFATNQVIVGSNTYSGTWTMPLQSTATGSASDTAIFGESDLGTGVDAESVSGTALQALSVSSKAVYAITDTGVAVYASAVDSGGIAGQFTSAGPNTTPAVIVSQSVTSPYAADLQGKLTVEGPIVVTNTSGGGNVPHDCITRSVSSAYNTPGWVSNTVCQSNEVAIAAGGFCKTAGNMVGASTTSGHMDQLSWIWCTGVGTAIWYATCCQM